MSTSHLWFGWTRLVLAQSRELDALTWTSISWIHLLFTIENRSASGPIPMVEAHFQPLLTCPVIPLWKASQGVGVYLLSMHTLSTLSRKQWRKGIESSHGGQGGGSENFMKNNLFCHRCSLLGAKLELELQLFRAQICSVFGDRPPDGFPELSCYLITPQAVGPHSHQQVVPPVFSFSYSGGCVVISLCISLIPNTLEHLFFTWY